MARRIIYIDRRVFNDYKYNSPLIGKFINCMMINGKKSVAESNVYTALDKGAQQLKISPIELFTKVIENTKTSFIIIRRKIGANSVQIPHPVDEYKQISVAILNLKDVIRELQEKSKRSISECIEEILVNTYQGKGSVIKKKEEIEQTAIKNRVFSHYSWMRKKVKKKQAKQIKQASGKFNVDNFIVNSEQDVTKEEKKSTEIIENLTSVIGE